MIIGIDPGFTGAIAFLTDEYLRVFDLPVKYIMKRKQIDENALSLIIETNALNPCFCAIEKVHAMPNDGKAGAFTFGYNAGILIGVLAPFKINILRIPPAVWKSGLGLGRNKSESIKLARKLFPAYKDYFKSVRDHDGRAEAVLIAHYANQLPRSMKG